MKIKRNMNLVIPVDSENGQAYVHAAPISKEVYREHFYVLGKTFATIFSEGFSAVVGPRQAYLMLERHAKNENIWEGVAGVKNTLVNEVIRLANLVYPTLGKGFETMPLEIAIERELVEIDEVLDELIFFTCVSSINKPNQAAGVMTVVNGLWGAQTSYLPLTEWISSLPTLKSADNSGETESTSSVKSSTTPPEPASANSVLIAE